MSAAVQSEHLRLVSDGSDHQQPSIEKTNGVKRNALRCLARRQIREAVRVALRVHHHDPRA
jgi:hypothetical protein